MNMDILDLYFTEVITMCVARYEMWFLPSPCIFLPRLWYGDVSGTLFTSIDMGILRRKHADCNICLQKKKSTISLYVCIYTKPASYHFL